MQQSNLVEYELAGGKITQTALKKDQLFSDRAIGTIIERPDFTDRFNK